MTRLPVFFMGNVVGSATSETAAKRFVSSLGIRPARYEWMTCTRAHSFNLDVDAFYVGLQMKGKY